MREYTIELGGLPHTVLLTDEDAKRRGLSAPAEKQADAPKNKARTAADKKG